ncbi:hypothetical protein [Nonomuraea basaltis]|uniref:recombination directionality factor n=1 Tax=Nonomuraea basaltis TaxID=2495887 RepID=UPI00110C5CF9|nr:hypothetical protein [Nonomuraea basaltis]TMR91288.1 hypothetical protein EJK15_50755 [Nonomuraea basaltis]
MIQRRLAEVGRIRLGRRVPTKSGTSTRPEKLATFRFTSGDRNRIEQIAALYGGTVQPWEKQWEVITQTDRVPITVPPNASTEWMELWSGGGAVRRCNGEVEQKASRPCLCRAAGTIVCKPHTRVNLILSDLPGMGTWRIEPKSWDAAAELPDMVEFLASLGRYVEADLTLSYRTKLKEGKTFEWWVPNLDPTNYTAGQLAEASRTGALPTATPVAIGGRRPAAIEAPGRPSADDLMVAARLADTTAELKAIWEEGKAKGVTFAREQRAEFDQLVVAAKRNATQPAAEAVGATTSAPDQETDVEIVDAEPVADDDEDLLWMQIIKAWSGTVPELEAAFAGAMGAPHFEADATLYASFLAMVKAGKVAPLGDAA